MSKNIIKAFWIFGWILLSTQLIGQEIIGKVLDADTKAPLPFANISLNNSSIGTTTNEDGDFILKNVPLGRHDIAATYLGYATKYINQILVSSGKQTEVIFLLKPSSVTLDDVVVTYHKGRNQTLNNMAGINGVLLSVDEGKRMAGSLADPARLAMNFAGVASGNLQDNAIVVRGNSPKGILWRVEGVEVFNPNHMAGGNIAGGGFLNIFSTNLLSNSDFFTGAFPSEYGNALSGVFDINLRNGNTNKREHFIQLGVLGLEMGSEGYFKKGSAASYNVGLRLSSMGLIGKMAGGEAPSYQDLSFKTNFPTKKAGTFSFWGIGGLSQNHKPIRDYQEQWEDGVLTKFKYPQYETDWTDKNIKWEVGAMGLSHRILLGKNTSLKSDISATGNSYSYKNKWFNEAKEKYYNDKDNYVAEWKYTIQSTLNHRFSSKLNTQFGLVHDQIFMDYKVNQSPKHEMPMENLATEKNNTYFSQAYGQLSFSPINPITLSGGLHLSHFGLTNELLLEPRANIKWSITPNHSIGLSYGKHSQREELKIYFTPDENGIYQNQNLKMEQSNHYVFTYEWMINEHLRFRIEPYYQTLNNIPVSEKSSFSMANYKKEWLIKEKLVNKGTAENIGVDITMERFFDRGWYLLLTGSLFESKYKGVDGIERNSLFNRQYVANLLVGKEFIFDWKNKSRVLSTNLKLNYMGGYHFSPILREESLLAREAIYDNTKAFSEQGPASLYVDVAFSFKTNHKKWSGTWMLEMKNASLQEAYNGYRYNYTHETLDKYYQFFIMPQLAYRIEF